MNTLNYAQKTNFICGCSLFPDLEFYVQNITLPGITFQLSETKVLNLSHFTASTNHSYGDLGISFLLDEDYKIYDMFFNEMLNSKSLTNGTYAQRNFDLWIQVYNNKGNLLFTEYFYNCMLSNIADIPLSTTDSSVANTISVGIEFDWLEVKKDGITSDKRKQFGIYPEKENKCDCKQ